jgi:anti-anti-sigma factor
MPYDTEAVIQTNRRIMLFPRAHQRLATPRYDDGLRRHTIVVFTSMEINYADAGSDTAVVSVAGEVMIGPESEQITTLVSDLLRKAKRVIIFDVAGVTKIDSTGIGRFISSYNQVAAAGGEIRMAAAAGVVFKAFRACRLDTVFRFYPTVDEACKALVTPNAKREQHSDRRR